MRKAAFAILGALLIAGSTVQAATAKYHHVSKARVAPIAASQQFRDANDASYCRQRWAYYDLATREYMGDDGEWRPCS
jgi:hypothetical protein